MTIWQNTLKMFSNYLLSTSIHIMHLGEILYNSSERCRFIFLSVNLPILRIQLHLSLYVYVYVNRILTSPDTTELTITAKCLMKLSKLF